MRNTYMVTISWPDKAIQFMRHKETVDVDLSGEDMRSIYNILDEIQTQGGKHSDYYKETVAIEFMMKLGE